MSLRWCKSVVFLATLLSAHVSSAQVIDKLFFVDKSAKLSSTLLRNQGIYSLSALPSTFDIDVTFVPAVGKSLSDYHLDFTLRDRKAAKNHLNGRLDSGPFYLFGDGKASPKTLAADPYVLYLRLIDAKTLKPASAVATLYFTIVKGGTVPPTVTPVPVGPTPTPIPQNPGEKTGLRALADRYHPGLELWVAVSNIATMSAQCKTALIKNFHGIIPETATRWTETAARVADQQNLFKFAHDNHMKVEANHLMWGQDQLNGYLKDRTSLKSRTEELYASNGGMDRIEVAELMGNGSTVYPTMIKNTVWARFYGVNDVFFSGIDVMRSVVPRSMEILINDYLYDGQPLAALAKGLKADTAHSTNDAGISDPSYGNVAFGEEFYNLKYNALTKTEASSNKYIYSDLTNYCEQIHELGFPFKVTEVGVNGTPATPVSTDAQASMYSNALRAYLACEKADTSVPKKARSIGFWYFKGDKTFTTPNGTKQLWHGLFDSDCNEKPTLQALRGVLESP